MEEKLNRKLEDDMLLQATGGVTKDADCLPDYDATGVVEKQMGSGESLVCLDDGAQVIASAADGHVVEEGKRVGLFAQGGGWTMQELPG